MKKLFLIAALFGIFCFVRSAEASNISTNTTDHWAWNPIIGWIQLNDVANSMTPNVTSHAFTGYASSSIGDISFDCGSYRPKSQGGVTNVCASSNYQVLNDGLGNLSGWAWNDTIGWISFCGGSSTANCPRTISYSVFLAPSSSVNTSDFEGFAWNDIVGWISFCGGLSTANCPGLVRYTVNASWIATSTYGYLESSTFDLGANGGQPNSVMWHGSFPANTTVGFQFAASSTNGAWSDADFHGPLGTSNNVNDLYKGAPDTMIDIVASSSNPTRFTNLRYFRYRVYLISDQTQTFTPQVNDVVVNWSP